MAAVTFFRHSDVPKEKEPTVRLAPVELIEKKNAILFYAGKQGKFVTMVRRQA